jgi:hypothetical protein
VVSSVKITVEGILSHVMCERNFSGSRAPWTHIYSFIVVNSCLQVKCVINLSSSSMYWFICLSTVESNVCIVMWVRNPSGRKVPWTDIYSFKVINSSLYLKCVINFYAALCIGRSSVKITVQSILSNVMCVRNLSGNRVPWTHIYSFMVVNFSLHVKCVINLSSSCMYCRFMC